MQKNALVTGGTRGIGKAIVHDLHRAGTQVVYTGRSGPDPDLPFAAYLELDLACSRSTENLVRLVSQMSFYILVNNAGINQIQRVDEITDPVWDNILRVNLSGARELMRAVIPHMQENMYGRIVNIGSIFGNVSKAWRAPYSASKSGLAGLTREIAVEVAPYGITVNTVSPGFTDTELTRRILSEEARKDLISRVPLQRMASPDEIAKTVTFVASEHACHLTGQEIIVDGGFCVQ